MCPSISPLPFSTPRSSPIDTKPIRVVLRTHHEDPRLRYLLHPILFTLLNQEAIHDYDQLHFAFHFLVISPKPRILIHVSSSPVRQLVSFFFARPLSSYPLLLFLGACLLLSSRPSDTKSRLRDKLIPSSDEIDLHSHGSNPLQPRDAFRPRRHFLPCRLRWSGLQ